MPLLQALVLAILLGHLAPAGSLQLTAAQLGLSEGLYADRLALLDLKAAITPTGYGSSAIKAGWPLSPRSPNFNPCNSSTVKGVDPGVLQTGSWPHITCFEQRVIELKLTGMGIVGSQLPDSLGTMGQLNLLNLGNNRFSGSLPNAWAGLTLFSSLETLRLNDNLLSGTLPAWNRRGAFRRLSELYLDGNSLEGELPTTWAGPNRPLRSLTVLSLSRNSLGQLPGGTFAQLPGGAEDWGTADRWASPFPRLKFLNLDRNYFTGPLPATWGQPYAFSALRKLYLGNNQLTGTLPASFADRGAFPRLQELQLQWNSLGGTTQGGLPTDWQAAWPPRAFPSLRTLMLFNGNSNICGQPAAQNIKLQGDAGYVVQDATGRVYEPNGTWRACS